MYCPRCSTENSLQQGYCRHCGLTLNPIRLALEGRVDDSLVAIKRGGSNVNWGLAVVLMGLANALIFGFLGLEDLATLSLILGFLNGMVLIILGATRIRKGNKLLSLKEPSPHEKLEYWTEPGMLPPRHSTNPLPIKQPQPASVVENTTLELRKPD